MSYIGDLAGFVGGFILLIGLFVYLRAIFFGKVSSNRVTWGIWILVNALFCLSYYEANGLVSSIWVPLIYLIGTATIFIFLLKFGEPGHWSWVEKTSFLASLIILMLWFIYRSPISTLSLTLLLDIFGAIPLISTVWKNSHTEYAPAWYFGFVANAINLLAVERWDYANASYPIYLTALTLSVALLIRFPQLSYTKRLSI